MIPRLIRSSVIVLASTISAVALLSAPAHAGVPPEGYKSWEILGETGNGNTGEVPFRRGFYDDEANFTHYEDNMKNHGFGLDKVREKHGLTSQAFIGLVITRGKIERKPGGESDPYGTAVRARLDLQEATCIQVCNLTTLTHKLIAVWEDSEMDKYYGQWASVRPVEGTGTADPNGLVITGARYEEDEKIVGLVTCFEDRKNNDQSEEDEEEVTDFVKEFDVSKYYEETGA